MRYVTALFFILFYACSKDQKIKDDILYHIPTNSQIIISTPSLDDLDTFIDQNSFLKDFKNSARYKQINHAKAFLSLYKNSSESLVTISPEGKNDIALCVIGKDLEFTPLDSTLVKKHLYNDQTYYQYKDDNTAFYYTTVGGYHMGSSSQIALESVMRRSLNYYVFDDEFASIYDRTHTRDLHIYIKANNSEWFTDFMTYQSHESYDRDYAAWYQLQSRDTDLPMHLDGIITYSDSSNQYHSLFNSITAVEHQAARILPATTYNAKVISYNDADQLLSNLNKYHQEIVKPTSFIKDILDNSHEITRIDLPQEQALAFSLKPYEELFFNIDSATVARFNYRDYTIYELEQPINTATLAPILPSQSYKFICLIDDFMLLTASATTPESIIANYQNRTVIAQQPYYQSIKNQLSSASTLMYYSSPAQLKSGFNKKDQDQLTAIEKSTYPIFISQYVHENNYAHYRRLVASASDHTAQQPLTQLCSYKSKTDIIAGPFLFPNHKTGRYDIAFQDKDFELHLISNTGTSYWTQKLESHIIGKIHAVDGFKNGRKQLLFSTSKKIHFLDRNGKKIGKFPLEFKDPITQPLSVFDYDSNRNYRLLVTQDNDLHMFDITGKSLTGFTYKKDATITTQPQHFRVQGRDYIAFAKANQQLSLLHRSGKVRTKVSEKITPESDLFLNKNQIAIVHNNRITRINIASGKLTQGKKINANAHYALGKNIELIQENEQLNINGKELELPYGTYSKAQITSINNSEYIHLVDQGEHQLYVINSDAKILDKFPVYGTDTGVIGYKKTRILATRDHQDIIVYSW